MGGVIVDFFLLEIFLYACIICIQNRFSSRTSMPEKPTKEDVEKPAMLDVVKGVTDNLKEYATRVTKVQSVNEWMELNQQLLDSPFAGLDRVGYVNCSCCCISASLQQELSSVYALVLPHVERFNSLLSSRGM